MRSKFTPVPPDAPFHDVADSAVQKISEGWDVYQKWTCQHCRARQTMPDRNKFYERGICEECGRETNIRERGCNYMATTPSMRPIIDAVMRGDE